MERAVEALLLGFSTGLACTLSCGAVLVPWLVAQRRTFVGTASLLGQILLGRLAGYLLYATAAWAVGRAIAPADLEARALLFGLAHLLLAGALVWYALSARSRRETCTPPAQRGILGRLRARLSALGPAGVGFLTGINLCPPFVAATVRAAESPSLPSSLAFFTAFFVGTSVWFLPFLATGAVGRIPVAATIARVAMGVVAVYYGYLGAVTLGWRLSHG